MALIDIHDPTAPGAYMFNDSKDKLRPAAIKRRQAEIDKIEAALAAARRRADWDNVTKLKTAREKIVNEETEKIQKEETAIRKEQVRQKNEEYQQKLRAAGIIAGDQNDAISRGRAAYERHTQQQIAAQTAAAQAAAAQTPAALTEEERYKPVVGDQEEPKNEIPAGTSDKPKVVDDQTEPRKETPDPGGVTWEQVIGATSLFNIAANIPALMQKRQEVGMLPTPKLQYITWNRDSKEHLANVDRQVDRGQRGAMDYMRKIGGQALYSPADGDASVMQYTAEAARQDQAQLNAINAANIGIANQEVAMLEAEKNAAREYQFKTDAMLAQGRQNAMGNISNSIFDYYQSLISLRDRVGGLNKWYSRNKPTPEETVDAIETALPEGDIASKKTVGLPKRYNPPLVPPMNSSVDLTGSYGAAEDMKRRIPMELLEAKIRQGVSPIEPRKMSVDIPLNVPKQLQALSPSLINWGVYTDPPQMKGV